MTADDWYILGAFIGAAIVLAVVSIVVLKPGPYTPRD